ncbi:MAG: hypothetical protein ACRD2Z_05475 [Thermoanaerobaculia bacterium]
MAANILPGLPRVNSAAPDHDRAAEFLRGVPGLEENFKAVEDVAARLLMESVRPARAAGTSHRPPIAAGLVAGAAIGMQPQEDISLRDKIHEDAAERDSG